MQINDLPLDGGGGGSHAPMWRYMYLPMEGGSVLRCDPIPSYHTSVGSVHVPVDRHPERGSVTMDIVSTCVVVVIPPSPIICLHSRVCPLKTRNHLFSCCCSQYILEHVFPEKGSSLSINPLPCAPNQEFTVSRCTVRSRGHALWST
jgi:hypothetical protein